MAAADYEPDARKDILVERDFARVNVRLKMIDRDERQIIGDAKRLGRRKTDQQGSGEPRLVNDGDRVEIAGRKIRLFERLGHDRKNRVKMLARRYFRNDAPVKAVRVDLGREQDAQGRPPFRQRLC